MTESFPESPESPAGAAGESPSAPTPPQAPRKGFARRHWLLTTLFFVVGLPLLGLGIWTAVALNWSYSSGKRAGYVQKISRKGFICKTWEGTLYTDIAKGFRSDSFSFSVRSDSIAHQIEQLSGKRVAVEYQQHLGVPTSCFGETEYFVTGVQSIPE
jgi:hypothetical protein